MSFFDKIFGGESKTGIRMQQGANLREQRMAQESTAAARQDLLDIYPRAKEAQQQSERAAIDVLRKAPQSQLRALSRAGTNAQRALLGGMSAFENAIMGSPTGIVGEQFGQNPAGLRPVAIGMSEFVQAGRPFHGTQQPHWLGTQRRDWDEFRMRRDQPGVPWEYARPNSPGLAPEQYRGGVMYDFGSEQAALEQRAPQAPMTAMLAGIPALTWSGR